MVRRGSPSSCLTIFHDVRARMVLLISVVMLVAAMELNSSDTVATNHASIGNELPNVSSIKQHLAIVLVCIVAFYFFVGLGKSRDSSVGALETPQKLKVFATWAQRQIEDSRSETHRQILDDVISTFANYAQRLEETPTRAARRSAVTRMQVLTELLEIPSVNSALRAVNWAWLREWDRNLLRPHEARFRCTVIFPTICAAASLQQAEWLQPRNSIVSAVGGKSQARLAYLAAWCADFLERPDVRAFLESQTPDLLSGLPFLGTNDLESCSSDDEDEESPSPRKSRKPSISGTSNEYAFSRRRYAEQENCWDAADATQAMVRGAQYLNDYVKVNSQNAMLELVDADLLKSSDEIVHYVRSPKSRIAQLRQGGDSRFFFVINFRLPPIHFALTWALPSNPDWHSKPEGILFRRFLEMTDAERNQRVKVLPKITKGPWLVKNGVPEKPGVVGRKLQVEYFIADDHMEVSINCISSATGRRIVQLLTGAARHFCMEVHIILEGQQEDELPERVLGGVSVFHGELSQLPMR